MRPKPTIDGLHFRLPPVDFCSSRLAIRAATERARALAMPAGTRAQAFQTRANSSGVVPVWACFTMVSARLSNSRATLRACVWERELIRARTGEGRKRAKERGVRFGRPPKMTPHQRQETLQRLNAGETQADARPSLTNAPIGNCRNRPAAAENAANFFRSSTRAAGTAERADRLVSRPSECDRRIQPLGGTGREYFPPYEMRPPPAVNNREL